MFISKENFKSQCTPADNIDIVFCGPVDLDQAPETLEANFNDDLELERFKHWMNWNIEKQKQIPWLSQLMLSPFLASHKLKS